MDYFIRIIIQLQKILLNYLIMLYKILILQALLEQKFILVKLKIVLEIIKKYFGKTQIKCFIMDLKV